MADKEYIILRQENPIGPPKGGIGIGGPGAGPLDLERDTGALELEQTHLSKAEHEDLRRDPRTRVMAEPMPMRLIEPLDAADVEVSDTATATWGINAISAPDSPFTGEGITVAVLDTGIDPNHPAFTGIDLIQKNFTTEGDDDRNGHGTHCAGTIFGQDVDGQRIGVARNIRRALIGKVLGQGGGCGQIHGEGVVQAGTGDRNFPNVELVTLRPVAADRAPIPAHRDRAGREADDGGRGRRVISIKNDDVL